jgi:hypothetical protein
MMACNTCYGVDNISDNLQPSDKRGREKDGNSSQENYMPDMVLSILPLIHQCFKGLLQGFYFMNV